MIITTDSRIAEQETPVNADWSGWGGTLKWLVETLHTNAALAGSTSNELQFTNKVTSSLSLASSAEDKERLQGVAKKTQEEAGKVFH